GEVDDARDAEDQGRGGRSRVPSDVDPRRQDVLTSPTFAAKVAQTPAGIDGRVNEDSRRAGCSGPSIRGRSAVAKPSRSGAAPSPPRPSPRSSARGRPWPTRRSEAAP